MIGMTENVFINTKNRSHSITAELVIPEGGAEGVILAQAGRFGGWSLYVKDGKPIYTYNYVGLSSSKVASSKPLPAGKVTVGYEFRYDGRRPGQWRQRHTFRQRRNGCPRADRPHTSVYILRR